MACSQRTQAVILMVHVSFFRFEGKMGCLKCDFAPSLPARRSASDSAVSSVVEHLPDTEGVTGSNPVSRTISGYLAL